MDGLKTRQESSDAPALPVTIAMEPPGGRRAAPPPVVAPLAAQLLAARLGMPQCRHLRRATPETADAAYAESRNLVERRPVPQSRSV